MAGVPRSSCPFVFSFLLRYRFLVIRHFWDLGAEESLDGTINAEKSVPDGA
jgi:hypothetical protein